MSITENQVQNVITFVKMLCTMHNKELTDIELTSLNKLLYEYYKDRHLYDDNHVKCFLNFMKQNNKNNEFNKVIEVIEFYLKKDLSN